MATLAFLSASFRKKSVSLIRSPKPSASELQHKTAKLTTRSYAYFDGKMKLFRFKDCRVYTNPKEVLIHPESINDVDATFIFSVNSAPQNTERRAMLRGLFRTLNTYIENRVDFRACHKFVHLFVVGSSSNYTLNQDLISESNSDKDLLMSHIEDSYETLTLKTFFALQVIKF